MRHSIADELACPACRAGLRMNSVRKRKDDCVEGFLGCGKCGADYPILDGVAVMVSDFAAYASQRPKVLGRWLLESKSEKMRKFLKDNAKHVRKISQDRYDLGGAWFQPYLAMHAPGSKMDRHVAGVVRGRGFQDFYGEVAKLVTERFPAGQKCLEIGCAAGNVSAELAKKFDFVFGTDRSFGLVREARRRNSSAKAEFLVADSLAPPFPDDRFGLVVSLNLLDLVEPKEFISAARRLLANGGSLALADPYDFRDAKGDPKPSHDGKSIRKLLVGAGFAIDRSTAKESYIPWILRIRERAYLLYFVDLIMARKVRKR